MSDLHALSALRFGTGLPADQGMTAPDGMLAALAGPDQAAAQWPGLTADAVMPLYQEAAALRRAVRGDDSQRDAYRRAIRAVQAQATAGFAVQLARAVGASDGFRERLVQFWADHFTAESRFRQDGALPALMVEQAIRPHVAGRFADMLVAATTHPAMLLYLDQVQSVGPGSRAGQRRGAGLNENLGRELLELHTLGVGGAYRQEDVRELAELLTGLTANPEDGFVFNPALAEPGAETVLGKRYAGADMAPVLELLGDLARHPDTARHLARKLAVHFVSDTPDEGMVAEMAAAFLAGDGALGPVYAAMFAHPAAFSGPPVKARQPFDFMVAALRALAVSPDDLLALGRGNLRKRVLIPLRSMGQDWGRPGGPDGWEEAAEAWITPQGMAARITWAMTQPAEFVPLPDPRDLLTRALGDRASSRLIWAVGAAENQAEGVGLVLAAPEFNRR
jgi:uncharacterized protein (DUF1800 family)